MLLEIDDWRSVGDLQYRFNKCFTNLNLQVFDANNARLHDRSLPPGVLVAHIRNVHQPGVVSIKSWFTKADVENLLRDQFGIWATVVPAREGLAFAQKDCGKLTLSQLNESAQVRQQHVVRQVQTADEMVDSW